MDDGEPWPEIWGDLSIVNRTVWDSHICKSLTTSYPPALAAYFTLVRTPQSEFCRGLVSSARV